MSMSENDPGNAPVTATEGVIPDVEGRIEQQLADLQDIQMHEQWIRLLSAFVLIGLGVNAYILALDLTQAKQVADSYWNYLKGLDPDLQKTIAQIIASVLMAVSVWQIDHHQVDRNQLIKQQSRLLR